MKPEDLKKWRLKNGYSQSQLAKRLKVDTMTVSRWERGKRAEIPSYLQLALRALECERKMEMEKENDHGKHISKR
jgi:transcriptional regulator with XRE-family HTH domain